MTGQLSMRIMVQDVWDEVRISAPVTTSLGDLKRQALAVTRVMRNPDGYVVKFRGAEVPDDATLSDAGIVPDANLIVLPRRRRPVR
ncbi:MAG TPA: hypothetical protein VFT04_10200 [Gemmatimonadales bacterium]|nr:hypothetical protein [Gemmatimonadales bacterium]